MWASSSFGRATRKEEGGMLRGEGGARRGVVRTGGVLGCWVESRRVRRSRRSFVQPSNLMSGWIRPVCLFSLRLARSVKEKFFLLERDGVWKTPTHPFCHKLRWSWARLTSVFSTLDPRGNPIFGKQGPASHHVCRRRES